MNPFRLCRTAAGAATAVMVARELVAPVVAAAPARLHRVNVRGAEVPAVLGGPIIAGATAGLALGAALCARRDGHGYRVELATAALLAAVGGAGLSDDLRGDEGVRGFRGHLGELAAGRVTGGGVKLVVGGSSALGAAWLLRRDRSVSLTAAVIALSANLINLLDTAPGRAAKVAALACGPLTLFGAPSWSVSGAGLLGALVGCLPADLDETAMLGDAGANAIGAVLGLGLALSLREAGRRRAVAVLVALNAASERWSFTTLIERRTWLRRLDVLGRRLVPANESNPSPAC